jgi:hypothetical protein
MKNFLYFLKNPLRWYRERQAFKKRIEEMRKRDPFIYK